MLNAHDYYYSALPLALPGRHPGSTSHRGDEEDGKVLCMALEDLRLTVLQLRRRREEDAAEIRRLEGDLSASRGRAQRLSEELQNALLRGAGRVPEQRDWDRRDDKPVWEGHDTIPADQRRTESQDTLQVTASQGHKSPEGATFHTTPSLLTFDMTTFTITNMKKPDGTPVHEGGDEAQIADLAADSLVYAVLNAEREKTKAAEGQVQKLQEEIMKLEQELEDARERHTEPPRTPLQKLLVPGGGEVVTEKEEKDPDWSDGSELSSTDRGGSRKQPVRFAINSGDTVGTCPPLSTPWPGGQGSTPTSTAATLQGMGTKSTSPVRCLPLMLRKHAITQTEAVDSPMEEQEIDLLVGSHSRGMLPQMITPQPDMMARMDTLHSEHNARRRYATETKRWRIAVLVESWRRELCACMRLITRLRCVNAGLEGKLMGLHDYDGMLPVASSTPLWQRLLQNSCNPLVLFVGVVVVIVYFLNSATTWTDADIDCSLCTKGVSV
eukprot:Hpha_TRINITY_DN15544_c2_g14::TRINITY_DN15544_c2_g14_i1::g.108197::m.108197